MASAFFRRALCAFAVWPADELAKDANAARRRAPVFRGVALAWNCRSQAEVDANRTRPQRRRDLPKTPQKTFWGGYGGYFADPDGHLWEVAHNPRLPLTR